jgi:hypothetical protein
VPAGGQAQRWTATVAFTSAAQGALTLVVSTGGHTAEVQRFAITGLRGPGSAAARHRLVSAELTPRRGHDIDHEVADPRAPPTYRVRERKNHQVAAS